MEPLDRRRWDSTMGETAPLSNALDGFRAVINRTFQVSDSASSKREAIPQK
jgi:hypothetical protein